MVFGYKIQLFSGNGKRQPKQMYYRAYKACTIQEISLRLEANSYHLRALFPLNLLIMMADSPNSPSHLAVEIKWLMIHSLSPQSAYL